VALEDEAEGAVADHRDELPALPSEPVQLLGRALAEPIELEHVVFPAGPRRAQTDRAAALPLLAASKEADHLGANLLRVGAALEQNPTRHPFALPDDPEQHVLGVDVLVSERYRLAERQLEHLLRPRRERHLPSCYVPALANRARHLGPDLHDGETEALEHPGRQTFFLAQEPKQQVLGSDVVVAEGAGLFLGENHHLAGWLGEAFEHRPHDSHGCTIRVRLYARLPMSGNALAVAFALAAGLAGAIQAAVSSNLGRRIGVLEAVAFGYTVSIVLIVAILLAARQSLDAFYAGIREPAWLWLAGVMSVLIVGAITYAPPRIGVLATTGLLIASQFLLTALIDQFGLFGLERIGMTWPRAVGLAFLAGGAALVLKR
jgi:transporter family-2 protein